MTDLDKMARELMDSMPDSPHGRAADFPEHSFVVLESEAFYAVRAALLTMPPGYALVPVAPTDEMVDAASDAHMPFGDMRFAITSAILAAPEVK